MRRVVLLCVLLAACSHDPVHYIPEADRRAAASDGSGPISVDELLARVRSSESTAPESATQAGTMQAETPGRIVMRFADNAIQPDAGQREALRQFAAASLAARQPVVVSSRPGSFDDPGQKVLGQRRAIAVARELSSVAGDVETHFDAALPADVVVVTQGAPP